MKKIYLSVLSVLAALSVAAQAPLDVTFDSETALNSIQEKFRKGLTIVHGDAAPCLSVAAKTASVQFNGVRLEPCTKYKLTLRAYTDRADCIESNDNALAFARAANGRTYPEYLIRCFDKDGKPRNLMLYGKILINYSAPVISRNAADYVYVFYTPDNTAEMQLELRPNRNKLFVERFRLEKEEKEGTVNCNPDFRYGPLNPNGWHHQTAFYQVPGGDRTVARCGYFNGSPFFLLDGNGSYSYYCKGVEAAPGKGVIVVNFFDAAGVKTGTTHLFHGNEVKDGAARNGLKPPPGTSQAQFNVTNMILSDWRVVRD